MKSPFRPSSVESHSRSQPDALAGMPAAELSPVNTNHQNMLLLIQLRWIAVAGQVITIAVVQLGLGFDLPLIPMTTLLALLAAFNLGSLLWLRQRAGVGSHALLYALMIDVVALTAQLYLSGGVRNPFIGLYLLQITLAAVLLNARAAWSLVLMVAAALLLLTQYFLPLDMTRRAPADMVELLISGMLICYAPDGKRVWERDLSDEMGFLGG